MLLHLQRTEPQLIIDTTARISGANIVVAPTLCGTVNLQAEGDPWRDVLDATVEPLGHHVVELDRNILYICKKEG